MAHSIQDFKSALKGGGARANLFEVSITLPGAVSQASGWSNNTFSILCKAAALPASNIANVDVPFRGRIFKVAGERTYDPWTITIINDEDFAIRKTMENWAQAIAQYADGSGYTAPGSYMAKAIVNQLKRTSSNSASTTGGGLSVAATYEFIDIFPTNISAIDLSYDTENTIEEFTVEFQVQYWRPYNVNDTATTGPAATTTPPAPNTLPGAQAIGAAAGGATQTA